jgi:HTH domain
MDIFKDFFLLERIDHLIRTRATGTPAELAARLDTSLRNVYRLISDLKEQGFPIAYDKQKDTYYYNSPVKIELSIVVSGCNLIAIKGGEKKLDFFAALPNFGSADSDLCTVL